MVDGLQVFLSNRLEELFAHFKQWLVSSQDPFEMRLVVVPHPQAKHWLQLQLALAPDVGIAAGLQILTLDRAIDKLASFSNSKNSGRVPSRLEMSLALYQLLQQSSGQIQSKKEKKRALAQSEELADLFATYGLYGSALFTEWRENPAGWQQRLWRDVYQHYPDWRTEADVLANIDLAIIDGYPLRLATFGLTHVAPLHHAFLTRLAQVASVTYFMPSPCQHYWSDTLSGREGRRLAKRLQKTSIPLQQQETLHSYLQDTNPLLANLGKLGRVMARQVDESELETESCYVVSATLRHVPCYAERATDDTLFADGAPSLTLLHALQADMVLLRNPQDIPVTLASDASIQIHVAQSRLREVEVLYDVLMGIIHQHSNENFPLTPRDILVVTPDIEGYQSSIDAVFGASYSKLPFRIVDASWASQSAFVVSFICLLDLASSRWDTATVLQLWENPHLQHKHAIAPEELDRIKKAIDNVGITWGKNLAHRNELLSRSHCLRSMSDDGEFGTWDCGVGQLLESLATGDAMFGFEDADVLHKWIALFDSLWSDFQPLSDGTKLTLSDWVAYLGSLCDAYLKPNDSQSEQDRTRLLLQLDELKRAAQAFPQATFDFATVNFYLQKVLAAPRDAHQEGSLQAVRFGSIGGLRGEPSRVIACLGFEDGTVPRPKRIQALDLLAANGQGAPSPADEDRYYFLQSILSARDYLVITYCDANASDGKDQGPALVVGELITYLNRNYKIADVPAGLACVVNHPYFAFDESYFMRSGRLQGFVHSHYQASMAYSNPQKVPASSFLTHLTPAEGIREPRQYALTVKSLSQVAKDPLRFYLNQAGLYLHGGKPIKVEEPFSLNALQAHSIGEQTLDEPIARVIEKARCRGRLPLGVFGALACRDVDLNTKSALKVMRELGTDPNQLFDILLTADCSAPRQVSAKLLHLPPLRKMLDNGVEVVITGRIPNLSSAGLVINGHATLEHLVRTWPLLLLLDALKNEIELASGFYVPTNIACLKAGKIVSIPSTDSARHLNTFLEYALQSATSPSPLLAAWIKDILEKQPTELSSIIKNNLDDPHSHQHYASWIMRERHDILNAAPMESWQQRAKELYGFLLGREKK